MVGASLTVFYFFSFSDSVKQFPLGMVRSLIDQLLVRVPKVPQLIENLYKQYKKTQAPEVHLLEMLKALLKSFQEVYVIVDALDECNDRVRLMRILNQIREWHLSGLHMIVTCRDEPDLRSSWQSYRNLSLQNQEVEEDIRFYIHERL